MDTEKANGLNNELYKYENYIPKNSPNSNLCSFIYKQHPIIRGIMTICSLDLCYLQSVKK